MMLADKTDEQLTAIKTAFGRALLKFRHDAFAAAHHVLPGETGAASQLALEWEASKDDPVIMQAMGIASLEHGPLAVVPTKEEFAAALYNGAPTNDPELKLRYWRTFAEVMGYIEKGGGVTVNNNTQVNNAVKIMRVPVAMSDDEWERKAKAHQAKLAAL